jgi:hypothetical protein
VAPGVVAAELVARLEQDEPAARHARELGERLALLPTVRLERVRGHHEIERAVGDRQREQVPDEQLRRLHAGKRASVRAAVRHARPGEVASGDGLRPAAELRQDAHQRRRLAGAHIEQRVEVQAVELGGDRVRVGIVPRAEAGILQQLPVGTALQIVGDEHRLGRVAIRSARAAEERHDILAARIGLACLPQQVAICHRAMIARHAARVQRRLP